MEVKFTALLLVNHFFPLCVSAAVRTVFRDGIKER